MLLRSKMINMKLHEIPYGTIRLLSKLVMDEIEFIDISWRKELIANYDIAGIEYDTARIPERRWMLQINVTPLQATEFVTLEVKL